ncbi:hypothetical protein Bca52824_081863 [Brassica carinata]|uniref:Uncharacterized protein n=1 Tax=Brassica carinata TaxID=52824 RepID=A0A8X7PJD9_BRACI|nr:hypothetical protein Bca52824_081863 [Brassica carinata]
MESVKPNSTQILYLWDNDGDSEKEAWGVRPKLQEDRSSLSPYQLHILLSYTLKTTKEIIEILQTILTRISSSPCISSTAHKPSLSFGSGSQLFSFGHFRSYSMSALPASNTAPDNYSGQNITKWSEVWDIRALIFLRCPIGAGYILTYCNTDDLLCIQIKNVAPTHTPNIIININAIKIVFEDKAGKSASPSFSGNCMY